MKSKINKKGVYLIVEIAIFTLFVAGFCLCLIAELVSPTSALSQWLINNVWDVRAVGDFFKSHLKTFLQSVAYIVIVLAVSKLLRFLFKKYINKSNRAKTIITLSDAFVKYGCAIAIIILVLKAIGVNTAALFASVGVLTLVVGLGAQTLIADIIAGMFIIFENEYNVGEIVTIDGFRGEVSDIGIRTTKIVDYAGNIKIINNSNISDVVNMSRELSVAVVSCDFPYDVPLQKIENLLKANLDVFAEKIPAITQGPFYKGVDSYGDSNIQIKLIAQCSEADRFQVQRDMLREYRLLLVENGIDISYHQVVINQAKEKNEVVKQKDKLKADLFAEEQKSLSKDMDTDERL